MQFRLPPRSTVNIGLTVFTQELHFSSLEALITSLYLLVSVTWFYMLYVKGLVRTGNPVSQPDTFVTPAKCLKLTDDDIERVFQSMSGDYENSVLNKIGVCRVPLDAPFSISNPLPWLKCFFQQQFTPFDYHAIVVFETSDGKFWSAEKMRDGVYLSCGESELSVLLFFDGKKRSEHLYWELRSTTSSSLTEVANQIKRIGLEYLLWTANCKHFSKALFNKLADDKWDFRNPSLQLLFSNQLPLVCLAMFISLIFEIIHSDNQYLVFGVMLFALIVHERYVDNEDMIVIITAALMYLLIGECFIATPLCTALKRGEYYIELWKSGSLMYKCLLALLYMSFYVMPNIFCLYNLQKFIGALFDYLITCVSSNMCNTVLRTVRDIFVRLKYQLQKISVRTRLFIAYLITVVYFSSKS